MKPGEKIGETELDALQVGLRMAHPPNPEALREECKELELLESAGYWPRTRRYLGLLGPGYLQSAMTLGGGTASAALFAGAVFGYSLLWVAPLGMVLGLVMLSAIAHQTLSTGQRPWPAMRQHAGPFFAWSWALGALAASLVWQFPQYALASAVLVDMADVAGWSLSPLATGSFVLALALLLSNLYGRSPRLLRLYERVLKYMVWGIVLCFGAVVLETGVSNWGDLLRGFFSFEIPADRNGVVAMTLVLSGISAAVGINMVFLYPYSLLARGWGREHRRMARFDLGLGMLLPYVLATSLIVIATANTLHLDPAYDGTRLSPVEAARSLAAVVGIAPGRMIFGLGILGMALSSITLQMLTCGFVCAEIFGWKFGGTRYRLATLLPIPGVLGCVYWSEIAIWVAVPTNVICGLFLPGAYAGFILLQRSRAYLGSDLPEGAPGRIWIGAMGAITLFLLIFLGTYVARNGGHWWSILTA